MIVRQLRLVLAKQPTPRTMAGVRLRTYAGEADTAAWLEVRRRAFADEAVGVGAWGPADFDREFLAQPWWRPDRLWLAETAPIDCQPPSVIGTVALMERGTSARTRWSIHWLAMVPEWRGRGIGRLLLDTAHRAAWDAGGREVWAETHAAWIAANRLYEAAGYRLGRPTGDNG